MEQTTQSNASAVMLFETADYVTELMKTVRKENAAKGISLVAVKAGEYPRKDGTFSQTIDMQFSDGSIWHATKYRFWKQK